jgi:hypothetical protein
LAALTINPALDSVDPTTVAIHVSNLTTDEAYRAREFAQQLQDRFIRVILIAHGNNVSNDTLITVVGNQDYVFTWKPLAVTPGNVTHWLTDIMCPPPY